MKQKIYRSLCLTALVTLVISTLASLFVYFDFFDRREDESLMMQAEALTIGVDEIITGVSANEQQQISSFLLSYRKQAAADGGEECAAHWCGRRTALCFSTRIRAPRRWNPTRIAWRSLPRKRTERGRPPVPPAPSEEIPIMRRC